MFYSDQISAVTLPRHLLSATRQQHINTLTHKGHRLIYKAHRHLSTVILYMTKQWFKGVQGCCLGSSLSKGNTEVAIIPGLDLFKLYPSKVMSRGEKSTYNRQTCTYLALA